MPAKRSRLASPDEQRENNFLPKNGELCYDCDVVGRSCRRGAGATTRWSWGIAERGVERIDSIRPVYPGVPARTGNRDGGEFSATVDPALRAPGRAAYARARLAHAGPGQRWAGDRPNGSRLETWKWRRKSLERLDSRPEMAPRRDVDRHAGGLPSSIGG